MDNKILNEHLNESERAVALGHDHISRQRMIVENLKGQGLEAAASKQLLETFLEIQKAHEERRDRLKQELGLL
jgi:hypothetical protein